ncbi:cell division protein FtsQ [Pantoea sp. Nvir]|uniref:cell division protein FtsQ n=1 Tax=Pantoea sp. Nvir TaxID=2576760 RepID=UPI00135C365F|nr:cell division protein FtsQ [Pantoea sp. Nvir]MXP66854.1 cell division protein FtsQ [Pantoea sp. Nvir]CAJ0991276.1 Cell division protein FtsQ [Pantoea sp. Nvir]
MSQAALNVRHTESQEQERKQRNNGTKLFDIFFLLIVIGIMIFSGLLILKWMNNLLRLPDSRLIVTCETHYTTDNDIRQAILASGTPGTFISQDINVIQKQIKRLPWIKQVSVRKQWPDKLKIHLVEYVPMARWNDLHMVDSEGISFSVPVRHFSKETMPMLYGPEGSEKEVLVGYHSMNNLLKANKLILKVASMTARRSWQLVTSDDIRIELGRDETMKRLKRFTEIYSVLQQQGKNDHKRLSYVDLRYASGAAVGWIPVPVEPVELQDSN